MIHDDDIAEGLPCTIVYEDRRQFPGVRAYLNVLQSEVPAEIVKVERAADGVVRCVRVRFENVPSDARWYPVPFERNDEGSFGGEILTGAWRRLDIGERRIFPEPDEAPPPAQRTVAIFGTPEGAGFPWSDWALGPNVGPLNPPRTIAVCTSSYASFRQFCFANNVKIGLQGARGPDGTRYIFANERRRVAGMNIHERVMVHPPSAPDVTAEVDNRIVRTVGLFGAK